MDVRSPRSEANCRYLWPEADGPKPTACPLLLARSRWPEPYHIAAARYFWPEAAGPTSGPKPLAFHALCTSVRARTNSTWAMAASCVMKAAKMQQQVRVLLGARVMEVLATTMVEGVMVKSWAQQQG